ncbi:MAG: leucine-rich repeat domain-containing protein [Clostridia bacterium]|nr:leucine-rich repeat domain-containing protein [Clostridia bacterium]
MKRPLSLLLCLVLLGTPLLTACGAPDGELNNSHVPPVAYSEGLEYEYNSAFGYYTVTGMGTCTDTVVVIPEIYQGRPVYAIGDGAFNADKQPSVPSVPNKDRSIKGTKYTNMRATTVCPIDAAIAEETPAEHKITEVFLPDSIGQIGNEAFYGCEALAVFDTADLIGLIGTDAFKYTAFYMDEGNWVDGVLYLDEYLVDVREGAVQGEYTVREGTTHIVNEAFYGCKELTSLVLPDTLRVVGIRAFYECTALTAVDLAMPGISVGREAFYGCTSLATVTVGTDDMTVKKDNVLIPDPQEPIPGMTEYYGGIGGMIIGGRSDRSKDYDCSIDSSAFEGCTALSSLTLGAGVRQIGDRAFRNCTSLTSVDMGKMTAVADYHTFVDTPYAVYTRLTTLTFVFEGCTALTDVTLPKGILYLMGTFSGCTALTEFTVPDTVKTLHYTFDGCTSLRRVNMSEGLARIHDRAFQDCVSLENLDLPDSVTEIGNRAFFRMDYHTQILIGTGVKSIGENAFFPMHEITYRGTVADWEKIDYKISEDGAAGFILHCVDGDLTVGTPQDEPGEKPSRP